MITACGFLVVRRPEYSFDPATELAAPIVGDLQYHGVDREPWIDLFNEAFYRKMLPPNVQHTLEQIHAANPDLSGLVLCRELPVARRLLEFANRDEVRNELVVVRSPELARIKGTIDLNEQVSCWLGYDYVKLGEWSLIREGFFRAPQEYLTWQATLNRYGLFDSPSLLRAYCDHYREAAYRGISEDLEWSEDHFKFDAIEIGRVR